jgi:ABC-type antimicrobial peptide transport system permease subunit
VVGVAGDVRQTHADASLLDAYVPLLQNPGRFTFLYLPIGAATPARERDLREAVAEIDAELSIGTPMVLQGELDRARLRPRVLASMLSAFALFAVLLALLGMYGVVSYAVRQREREVAVRMAVGADRRAVTALFVRQGSVVLVAGLVAGMLGAAGMGRVLSAQLFGVTGADARVIAAAAAALLAGGLAAIWWPARRAASTDPAMVLKADF